MNHFVYNQLLFYVFPPRDIKELLGKELWKRAYFVFRNIEANISLACTKRFPLQSVSVVRKPSEVESVQGILVENHV